MKICISSQGNNLDAEVDPRFGRCKYFLIVDSESMDFETIDNKNAMAQGGAGIQAAETVANKGCKAAITGNVGPNAFRTLDAAGVKVYTGAVGSIKNAIESFKKGALQETKNASVDSHHGMSYR